MRTTMDRAGRLVIPKVLRDRIGLGSGAVEVDVEVQGAGLRIEPVPLEELVERDGVLMLAPQGVPVTAGQIRELRLDEQQ